MIKSSVNGSPAGSDKFKAKDLQHALGMTMCDDSESGDLMQKFHAKQIHSLIGKQHGFKRRSTFAKVGVKQSATVLPKRSGEILVVPSNSSTLLDHFALSEIVLEEKEVFVDQKVHDAYIRMLKRQGILPNSVFKRPPKTWPAPPPSWEFQMREKSMELYNQVYGP